MNEHKQSIIIKILSITLVLTIIFASMGVGVYFMKKNHVLEDMVKKMVTEATTQTPTETPTENQTPENNPPTEDEQNQGIVEEVTAPMAFMAVKESGIKLAPLNAPVMDRGTGGISQTISATVLPSTALNKAVDWTIIWADSNVSLNISDYLTITPDSDGSTTATVTCRQAFSNNAVIIVTTRESAYTAECLVTYVGVPTEMAVTCDGITISNNECALGVGESYSFNVAPTNALGSVGSNYQTLNVTLDAVGSVVLGNYTTTNGGSSSWSDTADHTVTVQSLLDNFIELSYSNGVATVTTKKTIESYYEYVTRMDGGRTKLYTNKYHSSVGDCYFRLTVTEPNSHVTKTIKITFDSSIVTGVTTNKSEISF